VEVKATRTSPPRHRHHSRTHRSETTGPPVPPKVPDAPQPRFERPPPTPRITRLPTPDLPDVGGDRFCTCDDTRDAKGHGHAKVCDLNDRDVAKCKKPVYVKMDDQREQPLGPRLKVMLTKQVEAALAYMKNVRK